MRLSVSDEDLANLTALVRSPVFESLKRLIGGYREQRFALLLSEVEHAKLLGIQGEIKGLNTIQNLPAIMVEEQERANAAKTDETSGAKKFISTQRQDYAEYDKKMAQKRAEMMRAEEPPRPA